MVWSLRMFFIPVLLTKLQQPKNVYLILTIVNLVTATAFLKMNLKEQYIITAVSFKLNTKARINTQYGAIQTELLNRKIVDPTIADISRVVSEIRVSKLPDPSTIGNAGSFFKNPVIDRLQFEELAGKFPEVIHYPAPNDKVKLAAGWLIEQCGFKGKVVGQTGTWKNQALVLVNHGACNRAGSVYFFRTNYKYSAYQVWCNAGKGSKYSLGCACLVF